MKKTITILSLALVSINLNAQTFTNFAGIAGAGGYGYSGDGGPATSAKINGVGGIAVDQAGNVFFSDNGNNVIRKVNTSGIITTVVGTGTAGSLGDGGPAISAQLNHPENIVFDAAGNLYIKEPRNGKIRKVDVAGNITTYATIITDPLRAQAMTIDGAGNLYVNNDNDVIVEKITPAGVRTTYAGMAGTQGASGDGGPAINAELWQAYYLTTDNSGNLYISEYQGNTVRKVNDYGIISTFAGVFGGVSDPANEGKDGDGGPATVALLSGAKGLAVNSKGELFVATDLSQIRYIDSVGIIHSIAHNYDILFPTLLAFDASDNLYYYSSIMNQIKKISDINSTVGLEEHSLDKIDFSIYPNPASKHIVINTNATSSNIKMQITDVIGQIVMKSNIKDINTIIDINNLNSGIYIITLSMENRSSSHKLIVE